MRERKGLYGDVYCANKEVHNALDKSPFIKHCQDPHSFTLLDHYLHLRQLEKVYATLEEKCRSHVEQLLEDVKLEKDSEQSVLVDFVRYVLLNQSLLIKQDCRKIKLIMKVPTAVQGSDNNIFKGSKAYVEYLTERNVSESFAHLTVRLLADISGGKAQEGYLAGWATQNDKTTLPFSYNHFSLEIQGQSYSPQQLHHLVVKWYRQVGYKMQDEQTYEGFIAETSKAFVMNKLIYDDLNAYVSRGDGIVIAIKSMGLWAASKAIDTTTEYATNLVNTYS